MDYQPGWGDTLAKVLPQISETVHGILHPNAKNQEALRQQIIKDPEYLNKLAKAERDNPGTGAHLYGKDMAPFFDSLTKTPEDRAVEAKANAAADYTGQNSDRVGEVVTTGQTPEDRAIKEVQAPNIVSETVARNAALPGIMAEAQGKQIEASTMVQKAQNGIEANKLIRDGKTTPEALIKAAMFGTTIPGIDNPGALADGLFATSSPVTVKATVDKLLQDQDLAGRMSIAQYANKTQNKDAMEQVMTSTNPIAARLGVNTTALFVAQQGDNGIEVLKALNEARAANKQAPYGMPSQEQINQAVNILNTQQGIQKYKNNTGIRAGLAALATAKGSEAKKDAVIALRQALTDAGASQDISVMPNGEIQYKAADGSQQVIKDVGFFDRTFFGANPSLPVPTLNPSPTSGGRAGQGSTPSTPNAPPRYQPLIDAYTNSKVPQAEKLNGLKASAAYKALSREEQIKLLQAIGVSTVGMR